MQEDTVQLLYQSWRLSGTTELFGLYQNKAVTQKYGKGGTQEGDGMTVSFCRQSNLIA